jgi:purine-binding chemotaxis protein CheW
VVYAVGTTTTKKWGASMAEEIQLVVFTLKAGENTCEYGVPITQVQEIIRLTAPTRLPQVPAFVEGIINLRGSVIPIIDLKKRFNMPMAEYTDETRIIVVDIEGKTVGIIVDQVAEVLRLPLTSIEPPPAVIGGLTAEYLTGVGKLEDRLLIMLDVTKVLSDGEKRELKKV